MEEDWSTHKNLVSSVTPFTTHDELKDWIPKPSPVRNVLSHLLLHQSQVGLTIIIVKRLSIKLTILQVMMNFSLLRSEKQIIFTIVAFHDFYGADIIFPQIHCCWTRKMVQLILVAWMVRLCSNMWQECVNQGSLLMNCLEYHSLDWSNMTSW